MIATAKDLLETAYEHLEYNSGQGYYKIADSSNNPNLSQFGWLDQAHQLGAETIFFVDDFPTVLFFKHDTDLSTDTSQIEDDIYQLFLKVWNTSRIPLFFVALPGELRVYSAYKKPIKQEDWLKEDRWLKRIRTITEITELAEFSRPHIESGQLFQKRSNDFKRENRVDHWLLKNLRLLRKRLEANNREKREYVHALIGRSIFIRYLEDRKVLVEDYFTDIEGPREYQSYTDVLVSLEDTYQLFHKLRNDFNGDLFPLRDEEERVIKEADLTLLQNFLRGRSMADQPDLLFWAYQFDIIPIELISNIYEEFYHESSASKDTSTHYTPTSLVDFVLSQSLTPERLDRNVCILDPACGSGIFLVEAFKRVVAHRCRRENVDQLSSEDLVALLTEQIVGFDINKSAIQVAAFSLYLAYLDFREPPDIRANKQLPNLIYDPTDTENSGRSLFHTNTFYLTEAEQVALEERISNKKRYAGRADDIRSSQLPVLPTGDLKFDVIVGNPPWGSKNSPEGDIAVQWCRAFRYPLGYKELSQCFMWRMQRLIKPDGEIGLLILSGVFFKNQDHSREFRKQLLMQNEIRAVYNFAHVRRVFFQGAIAPFAAIFYASKQTKIDALLRNTILYVSIKRQSFLEQLQAVIIDRGDLLKIRQGDFLANDWLWKTYMWGNSSDAELIGELKSCYPKFKNFMTDIKKDTGYGFRDNTGQHSTDRLQVSYELSNNDFNKSVPLSELRNPLEPRKIRWIGNPNLYQGDRLIVKRGISKSTSRYGEIQARVAKIPFAFSDNFIGFRLDSVNDANQTILLGVTLSSLAKYYFFLTCSMWGLWLDKVHINEFLDLPICFSVDDSLQERIVYWVNQIQSKVGFLPLLECGNQDWQEIQGELDEAIFDLYELSKEQRDLVRDMCQVTMEYFYEGTNLLKKMSPNSCKNWTDPQTFVFLPIFGRIYVNNDKEGQPWQWGDGDFDGPRALCQHRSSMHIQQTHVHPRFSPDDSYVVFKRDLSRVMMSGYGNMYTVAVPKLEALPEITQYLLGNKKTSLFFGK